MGSSTVGRASIALIIWLVVALGLGFFLRDSITRMFGPDTWWLVMGWLGLVLGLINFLAILILARKPGNA